MNGSFLSNSSVCLQNISASWVPQPHIHPSRITLWPLTGNMRKQYSSCQVQCSAGKTYILALTWILFWHQNIFADQLLPQCGNIFPLQEQVSSGTLKKLLLGSSQITHQRIWGVHLISKLHRQKSDGIRRHLWEEISFHRDATTQPTGPKGSNNINPAADLQDTLRCSWSRFWLVRALSKSTRRTCSLVRGWS